MTSRPVNPRKLNECLQTPLRNLPEKVARLCDYDLLCLAEREFRSSAHRLVIAEAKRRGLIRTAAPHRPEPDTGFSLFS